MRTPDDDALRKKARNEYRRKNREKINADSRAWRARNKDRSLAYSKKWRDANPDYLKNDALKRRYGISLEDRAQMLLSQGGKCAICETQTPVAWHVDHCHETCRVRGILCNNCNLMVGHAKESVKTLMSAVDYILLKGR